MPDRLLVTVHSQLDVENELALADALISIRGRTYREALIPFDVYTRGGILRLEFDDVAFALGKWVPCTEAHLSRALTFASDIRARGAETLAVHCRQGKSRSAAVALAILAEQYGSGREMEAVAELLAQDPDGTIIQPQPAIVAMADRLLERNGAIEAALEASCPLFVTWRAYWQGKAKERAAP